MKRLYHLLPGRLLVKGVGRLSWSTSFFTIVMMSLTKTSQSPVSVVV